MPEAGAKGRTGSTKKNGQKKGGCAQFSSHKQRSRQEKRRGGPAYRTQTLDEQRPGEVQHPEKGVGGKEDTVTKRKKGGKRRKKCGGTSAKSHDCSA